MHIKKFKNENSNSVNNNQNLCNTLIVCLGNPGYDWTRHNVGADLMEISIKNYPKKQILKNLFLVFFDGFCAFVYLCPDIMNDSGKNVMKAYRELNCENLIVIADDMETKLGKIKTSFATSAKGHNGIKSIINHFGSNRFWKIHIGIGRPENEDVSDFVLNKFTLEEKNVIISLEKILEEVLKNLWISILEKKTAEV